MASFLRMLALALFCTIAAGQNTALAAPTAEEAVTHQSSYTLGPVKVDQKYKSMSGPVLRQGVQLGKGVNTPAIWIKSLKLEAFENGKPEPSLEHLCHAWVFFTGDPRRNGEALTISQGQSTMNFPPGYAMRVLNQDKNTVLSAQLLNINDVTTKDVSYKLTFKYVTEEDAQKMGLVSLRIVNAFIHTFDLVPALQPANKQAMVCSTNMDGSATGFVVPPGRHEYRTPFPIKLAKYLRVHFIKTHLHAYGRSLALVDKTTGLTVWESKAENDPTRALITRIGEYSSSEGFVLDPTHQYELAAIYDNTTKEDISAMAGFRMYVSEEKNGKVSSR